MTIAVGFFDGVHLGHRAILAGADIALTFKNHPLSLLCPERAPALVMSLEERLEAIRARGVGRVIALDFTRELANTEPEEFVEWLKREVGEAQFDVRSGANWNFGRGGRGNADFLRERGISAAVVPYAEYRGEIVSSTRIRKAIAAGEMEDAGAMLGRPFAVRGKIAAGKGAGRSLGFPTINFELREGLAYPPCGAYAVTFAGRNGVANFGIAPTFGEAAWKRPVLEVHLLDSIEGVDIEKAEPCVELHHFIRPERKFASVTELSERIGRDCAEARAFFGGEAR